MYLCRGSKSILVPQMRTKRAYNRKIRKARRHFKITFAAHSFPLDVPPSEEYSTEIETPWSQYQKSDVYTRWYRRKTKKNSQARSRQNLNKIVIGDKVEFHGYICEVLQRLGRKTFKFKVLGYAPQVSRPMEVCVPFGQNVGAVTTTKVATLYLTNREPVDICGYAAKHIEYCDKILKENSARKNGEDKWQNTWLECRALWFCLGWLSSEGKEFDSWQARKIIGAIK